MNTQKLIDNNQITFNDTSYSIVKRLKLKHARINPGRNVKFTTQRNVRKLKQEELNEQLNSLTKKN
jgi:hypothetical protein